MNTKDLEKYYAKVISLLERSAVLESGRLIVVPRAFSSPVIYLVLNYDFAFLRVKTTGCAYGHHWPEEKAHVYRNHEADKELFLKWSEVESVEIYKRDTLPTQEESDERIKAWYADKCCEHVPTWAEGRLFVMACLEEANHAGPHSFGPHSIQPAHYEWAGIDTTAFDPMPHIYPVNEKPSKPKKKK